MRVTVVGLGKMGLPIAVRLAEGGAVVVGADIDPGIVDAVSRGMSPIAEEPALADRLAVMHRVGRLSATSDTSNAVAGSDAVIILVRLVTDAAGRPDYGPLDAATAAIGSSLRPGSLVCYETTVPVGDTRSRFVPILERTSALVAGEDFHVCFSPERVQAGRVFRDLDGYPKLVGGLTEECARAGERLYRSLLSAEVLVLSSIEAAEYTKIAENIYRDVNIALANELARYADDISVDIAEVINAANSQPLSQIHRPGIGVGGHCIPVYPRFFIERARDSRLATLGRAINDSMPMYACDRLEVLTGRLNGHRVLVLGLAFRGGVREAMNSMALPLVRELNKRGADVRVHDPLFGRLAVMEHGLTWGEVGDGWPEILVLQADHPEYLRLRPDDVRGIKAMLDGRGCIDPTPWRQAGVAFAAIGRP